VPDLLIADGQYYESFRICFDKLFSKYHSRNIRKTL
jgi:hypothetical protein